MKIKVLLVDDCPEMVSSSSVSYTHLAKDIHIITSQPRLDAIAHDFVEHYSELWTTGKAMFVCVNKVTCVRMYNLAQKYWADKMTQLEAQIKTASQQEVQELSRKLQWKMCIRDRPCTAGRTAPASGT